LTPGGNSTVHIYTQTIHRQHTRNKQYVERHNSLIRKSATVPSLCEVYRGICLTTEEKARKNQRNTKKMVQFLYLYPDVVYFTTLSLSETSVEWQDD